MRRVVILLGIVSLIHFAQACDKPIKPVDMTAADAPDFEINLDLPLEDRLKNLHAHFGPMAKPIIDKVLETLKKHVGGPLGLFVLKQAVSAFLYARAPSYLFDEVNSYSKATGVPVSIIALMNVFYEFDGTACTTMMVRLPDNTLAFGSNLDFHFSVELSKLNYRSKVSRGGKFLYYANAIYGLVGVLRGVVPGKFYVSINERYGKGDTFRNLYFHDGHEALYHLRYILENASDFDSAYDLAKNHPLLARAYYSIMGTTGNQACVVERSEREIHNQYCLSDDVWFLVQTNSDRDIPDPADDCRRNPAEQYLNNIGKNAIKVDDIQYLLEHSPNHVGYDFSEHSDEGTITTIIGQHSQDPAKVFWMRIWDWDELFARRAQSKPISKN